MRPRNSKHTEDITQLLQQQQHKARHCFTHFDRIHYRIESESKVVCVSFDRFNGQFNRTILTYSLVSSFVVASGGGEWPCKRYWNGEMEVVTSQRIIQISHHSAKIYLHGALSSFHSILILSIIATTEFSTIHGFNQDTSSTLLTRRKQPTVFLSFLFSSLKHKVTKVSFDQSRNDFFLFLTKCFDEVK